MEIHSEDDHENANGSRERIFDENRKSTIAVVSSANEIGKAERVIEAITGSTSHRWHISNKYYTATVHFRVFSSAVDAHTCSALIVVADDVPNLSLQDFDWPELDVKLLIRSPNEPSQLSENEANPWLSSASENFFEFIDFDRQHRIGEDSSDIGGIERAREALQAHHWPRTTNEQSKVTDSPQERATTLIESQFDDDFAPFQTSDSISADDFETTARTATDRLSLITDINDTEDFASMLAKVQAMRAHLKEVENMDDRKAQAERLAEQFADLWAHDDLNSTAVSGLV